MAAGQAKSGWTGQISTSLLHVCVNLISCLLSFVKRQGAAVVDERGLRHLPAARKCTTVLWDTRARGEGEFRRLRLWWLRSYRQALCNLADAEASDVQTPPKTIGKGCAYN
jgi:hypothetical protein